MDRLKRLLLHNWWLKLLSLALAYALWALVAQSPSVEIHTSAMLELRQVPPGLRVSGEVPAHIHL
ncbi:MAG: YbbR-like domain-containing protein, partial [Terriglobia bacterium]